DPTVREDAKKLLNWMASHRDYTKNALGTSEPAVFAEAILRLDEEDKEKREVVFQDLALVFNPGQYTQVAATWARESYGTFPVGK
ncbi:HNH endonuclease, partial [Xylella fastidiosa subsp. multiplex]